MSQCWPRFLGVGCLMLLCSLLVAQDQQPPTVAAPPAPLSLQACVAIALANQSDVLVGRNSVTAAQARTTQARSSYFPQVSIETSTGLLESRAQTPGNSANGDTAVTVTQNFYDGGLREAQVANAKYAQMQTDATLVRTHQTVTYNVTKAYLALLRAQALASVSAQQVAYIDGQLQQVQARIDAGAAAQVDALPLKAQLANAKVDALAAQNAIRTAAVQLQQSMGLTPAEHFSIADVPAPAATSLTYDGVLATALAQRPEVRQNQAAIDVAKTGVKTAKISLLPRPVVSGQLSQPIGSGDNDQSYRVSAGLVFDLFNGKKNRSTYDEARANLSSAEIRAAQIPKDITADVQTAYLTLTSAGERMAASRLSVEAAQQNFAAQEGRYQQGLAIPLDLLNAQLNVTTAQSNAVQAQYDYLTALAQLHYAMGHQGEVKWE